MRRAILFSTVLGLTMSTHAHNMAGNAHSAPNLESAYWVDKAVQHTVQGTVTDQNGGPLEGVTVSVVGSTVGTSTGANGQFSIAAPIGATLRFTSLGYADQDISVTSSTVNVTMRVGENEMDEVVVVGYGTQRRSNLTGAVSTVDTEKTFETRPITDVGRALQGAVSGLSVSTTSGDLGGDPTIRLRGVSGSLQTQGGASPLILVDGVEVPSLSMINPTDIETMSVVKDASAAIYGSRAAWGVILIKTKSGQRNTKTSINYSNNIALQRPTTTPVIAGGAEGARAGLLAQQRTNPALTGYNNLGTRYDDYAIEKMEEWERLYGGQNLGLDMVEGRDWEVKDGFLYFHRSWDAEDMYMRDYTPQQNHNLNITGGSDRVNYNAGFGLISQSGILNANPDKYNRYNLNLGINADINDWLTGFAKVLYSASDVTKPYSFNGDVYEPIFYMYRWPRNFPYGTIDGLPMRNAITDVEQANMNVRTFNMARFSVGGQATIMPGLTIDADYTYSQFINRFDQNGGEVTGWDFWNRTDFEYITYTGAAHNRARKDRTIRDRHAANMYATYDKSYDQHTFKFMGGANAELFQSDLIWGQRLGLLDQNYPQLGLATGEMSASSAASHWSTLGFFGRINYDYQDKYLLEVLARYDGSSRFNRENAWGFFPAVSAGYVVSREDFMDWSRSYLDFLKVRASWGSVGNQTVPSGLFLSTLSQAATGWVIDGVNQNTMTTPSIVSQDLTWETVTTQEIGVDAAFFQNKFNVTFNRFRRTVSNLITGGVILPSSYGAPSPLRNFGEMQTNGWELELAYNHSFSNGFNMRLAGQLSDFKETITKFDGQAQINVNGTSSNYAGKVIGEIWGYETDRLFQMDDFIVNDDDGSYTLRDGIPSQAFYETPLFQYGPGDVKYKDLNGDGVIGVGEGTVEDPGDRRIIGNSNPRYQYGFRADFSFKGFDLGFFLQGVGQRDIWVGGDFIVPGWRPAEAWYTHQMDYWTPENTGAFYYRPTNQNQSNTTLNHMPQTRYLMDMSYLRLKNLTFGYTLPTTMMERAHISKLRVFFSGENLLEFDNLNVPIDPETDYTGAAANDANTFGRSYPYRRTFSLGLQLTF